MARFPKASETFRSGKVIFNSSVPKNGEVYAPESSCIKWTSVQIKNMWIKQLCNRKVRDFAMALRARKISGGFEKQGPGLNTHVLREVQDYVCRRKWGKKQSLKSSSRLQNVARKLEPRSNQRQQMLQDVLCFLDKKNMYACSWIFPHRVWKVYATFPKSFLRCMWLSFHHQLA